MKIRLKNLARKLYLRRDRIWKVYTSNEIQVKSKDKQIVNFPELKPEDLDYEYIYCYVKDWIIKKYSSIPHKNNFTIEKVDGCEYVCTTKKCTDLKRILTRIHKDYKEIFLSKLEKRVVSTPESQVEDVAQQGRGIVQQQQTQQVSTKGKTSKPTKTKEEGSLSI